MRDAKKITGTLVLTAVLVLFTALVIAGEPAAQEGSSAKSERHEHMHSAKDLSTSTGTSVAQTTCPVMGGKINKALYVDADGKRIYVCCEGCIDKVKADPSKYIGNLEDQGITLARTPVEQTLCPVMGGKINKALYVDADGKRVYVCCEGCIDKVKADPSKYIGKLEDQGVTLASTPVEQTLCPVMGGKISKVLYADADGKRVYVCCKGCIDKIKTDPSKYIGKLEDQGVTLEKVTPK